MATTTEQIITPAHFVNRELSWLEFNARVLEEAEDDSNPLLERVKFLAIFSSNLDEFMMVRVSGMRSQLYGESEAEDEIPDQLTAQEQFERTHARARELVSRQYACLKGILPQLAKENVRLLSPEELSGKQRTFMDEFFDQTVYPVLTPMAIDPSHPTPHLRNRGLYLAAIIQQKGARLGGPRRMLAVVQIPSVLPRLIRLPGDEASFVLLEQFVASRLDQLFGGSNIVSWTTIRITRDADLDIDGDQVLQDLSKAIEEGLKALRNRDVIRLEVAAGTNPNLIDAIRQPLELLDQEIYEIDGPLDLTAFMTWHGLDGAFAHLRDEPFTPRRPTGLEDGCDVFREIRKRDVLVHHPYESFSCVIDFLNQAATDPDVLAIKITLYRAGNESPVVRALINAAENGKNVTAVVELKARFDEHTNVSWARQMERAGVHVVYGFLDLKTHCKITLVVRQEGPKLRRYVHLSTGNYNASTARLYTDLGIFTCRQKYGADATALFNLLTGYSRGHKWERLTIAPNDMHARTLELIQRETDRARAGQEGRIIAKLNALVDRGVIEALYRASQAGVQITLLVRGSCCLRPGIPGISDNIRVTSIIDRFLEHSRIYVFGKGEEADVFLSSADWMPRNFQRRVEVMFPVLQPALKRHILDQILPTMISDNVKAREMQPDGTCRRVRRAPDVAPLRAQTRLLAGMPREDVPTVDD